MRASPFIKCVKMMTAPAGPSIFRTPPSAMEFTVRVSKRVRCRHSRNGLSWTQETEGVWPGRVPAKFLILGARDPGFAGRRAKTPRTLALLLLATDGGTRGIREPPVRDTRKPTECQYPRYLYLPSSSLLINSECPRRFIISHYHPPTTLQNNAITIRRRGTWPRPRHSFR